MLTPIHILFLWFRWLLAVAIIAGAIYAAREWYVRSFEPPRDPGVVVVEDDRPRPVEGPGGESAPPPAAPPRGFRLGWDRTTAWLAGAIVLATLAAAGRPVGGGLRRVAGRLIGNAPKSDDDAPREERTGEPHRIRRPDGTEIWAECYGPADAPPVVFSHGWGATSDAWYYQKHALAGRFRLIVWDEPGLGRSTRPADRDYSLEKFAADLDAVLGLAGGRPAVLVGHSIGGMTVLTHAKQYPGSLGSRVAGLVLVHTTYTNPVRTVSWPRLATLLERPVLIPLLYLTIAVWPLAWVLNWLSYANGSIHRSTRKGSFAGTQTEGQVDFVARTLPRCRPDVLARGMLGMIGYDATAVLPAIPVPTLVVIGDRDTTTVPEAGDLIARTVPGATRVTLDPARHMGLLEHHARFNAALAAFIADCQPRPGGLAP